jgi:hypothetical protein
MAFIAELSLIFTEVGGHIPAIVTVQHVVGGNAAVT